MRRARFRPRVPPRFRPFALTDREDGSVWAIMCSPVAPGSPERIRIVSPPPAGFDGDTYPAYFGPTLASKNGVIRLLIRDGRLGFESPAPLVRGRRVLAPERTRVNYKNVIYELYFTSNVSELRGRVGYVTEVL